MKTLASSALTARIIAAPAADTTSYGNEGTGNSTSGRDSIYRGHGPASRASCAG